MDSCLRIKSLLFLLVMMASCASQQATPSPRQKIHGRDSGDDLTRVPIYQARVPTHWIRQDPSSDDSIADTTKPLCTFLIQDDGQQVRITVHNFPFTQASSRVPPQAQIARWERQFNTIDRTRVTTTPFASAGFYGFCFMCTGKQGSQPTTVIAWSMQLAPEHEASLAVHTQLNPLPHFKQMRADYTIKAVGPPDLISKHKKDITIFAQSFELIHEIPSA